MSEFDEKYLKTNTKFLLELVTGDMVEFNMDNEAEWGDLKITSNGDEVRVQYFEGPHGEDEPDEGFINYDYNKPRRAVKFYRWVGNDHSNNFFHYAPCTMEEFVKIYNSWFDEYAG